MLYALMHLPEREMAFAFIVGFVVLTWIGIIIFRPYARKRIHGRRNANDMIGFTHASFATLYGILLGLLAVEAYQDFSAAKDIVSKQALTLTTLYQDLDGFPQALRARLQEDLRSYADEALETHWPRDGGFAAPVGSSTRLRALLNRFIAFQPTTKSEELMHAEGVRQVNLLIEQRRALLASGADGIPAPLWWVVGLGAFLLILLMCLFDMELHVHLVLGSSVAIFLGSVVFLVAALDNPFNGGLTVSQDPIKTVRDLVMKPE